MPMYAHILESNLNSEYHAIVTAVFVYNVTIVASKHGKFNLWLIGCVLGTAGGRGGIYVKPYSAALLNLVLPSYGKFAMPLS